MEEVTQREKEPVSNSTSARIAPPPLQKYQKLLTPETLRS